jgi:rod shape-determining protein MreD
MIAGRGIKLIAASFAAAFVLSTLPLPDWATEWRPAWVPMVLIYWCINQPQSVGVFVGLAVGLLLDALTGSLLGQHAAALSVAAAATVKAQARLRRLPLWIQAAVVFAVVFLYQVLTSWIRAVVGMAPRGDLMWKSAASSMLLWPWLSVVLRDLSTRNERD